MTLLFAAERGGSLTELAAAAAENATNFSPRRRYTHGTAAAMRRGSVVCLSEYGDDTELSGEFLADPGDKPVIRLSAGLGTQRIGSGCGWTVWGDLHDTGLSLYDEHPVADGEYGFDERNSIWMQQQYAAKMRHLCSAEHGAGRGCNGSGR